MRLMKVLKEMIHNLLASWSRVGVSVTDKAKSGSEVRLACGLYRTVSRKLSHTANIQNGPLTEENRRKNKQGVKRENIKVNVGPLPYIGGISERRAMKKHQISTAVKPKLRRLTAGAKDGTGQKASNTLLIMQ